MVGGTVRRDLHCMWWLALLVFACKVLAGSEKVGCFKSLPSSFKNPVNDPHQSIGNCVINCRFNTLYFALYDGTYCYCGNEAPSSQEITDSCDTLCPGTNAEKCGGSNAYLVYRLTDGDAPDPKHLSEDSTSANGGTTPSGKSSSPTTAATPITTSSPASTTTANKDNDEPPVVISTVLSTSLVTASGKLLTTTELLSATDSIETTSSSSRQPGKKVKVGTVVGAAMGALVGLILALLLLIFILRRIAARREQERMEKEYQEAIKPIDYEEGLYMPKYAGNNSIQESKSSTVVNPFDDNRRVSNGSIINETIEPNGNVLTVVNPDQ